MLVGTALKRVRELVKGGNEVEAVQVFYDAVGEMYKNFHQEEQARSNDKRYSSSVAGGRLNRLVGNVIQLMHDYLPKTPSGDFVAKTWLDRAYIGHEADGPRTLVRLLGSRKIQVAREKMLVGTALKHAREHKKAGRELEAAEVIRDALVNLERRSKDARRANDTMASEVLYRLAGDAVLQIPNYLPGPPSTPSEARTWLDELYYGFRNARPRPRLNGHIPLTPVRLNGRRTNDMAAGLS